MSGHGNLSVASNGEDAAPETTRPSAAPETMSPRPPLHHRRPPQVTGCAAWPPQPTPAAERGGGGRGATSARRMCWFMFGGCAPHRLDDLY